MKVGLGSDQLPVEPLQQFGLGIGERIVLRCSDRVATVAGQRVDISDSMANGAGDAGMGGGIGSVVEARVIQPSREQGNRIMTAATPADGGG